MKHTFKLGLAALMAAVGTFAASNESQAGGGLLGNCYIRGDVGHAWGRDPEINGRRNNLPADPEVAPFTNIDFDDSHFAEIGFGCGRSHAMVSSGSVKDSDVVVGDGRGLRADITFGWRTSRDLTATPPQPVLADDRINTKLSTKTLMFNVYYDLGTWHQLTPYVGAGIGVAWHDLSEVDFPPPGGINRVLVPGSGREADLAWSLMAGVSRELGAGAKLDIGYRYTDLGGDVKASLVGNTCTGTVECYAVRVEDLKTHEFRIGIRLPIAAIAAAVDHKPLK